MTCGRTRLDRRAALSGLFSTLAFAARPAAAFGDAGAFSARMLEAGRGSEIGARTRGPARWARELVRRTSAPGKSSTDRVRADRSELFAEPFAVWCGSSDVGPLASSEVRFLERYLRLGGMLVVDDADPASGAFGRSVRRELKRALPETAPVRLDTSHVLFKTFYLLDRPVGRVLGPAHLQAIVRGKSAQVLLLEHDLLGALADEGEGWALPVEPGGIAQRERALRFAVNIAMYALCSDYKDDVVHAPYIMQRRGRARP